MSWAAGSVTLTGSGPPITGAVSWAIVPIAIGPALVLSGGGAFYFDYVYWDTVASSAPYLAFPPGVADGVVYTLDSVSESGGVVTATVSFPASHAPYFWFDGDGSGSGYVRVVEPRMPGSLFLLYLIYASGSGFGVVFLGPGADYLNPWVAFTPGWDDIAAQAVAQSGAATISVSELELSGDNTTPDSTVPFAAAIGDYAWYVYSHNGSPWHPDSGPSYDPVPYVLQPSEYDGLAQALAVELQDDDDHIRVVARAWDVNGRRYETAQEFDVESAGHRLATAPDPLGGYLSAVKV